MALFNFRFKISDLRFQHLRNVFGIALISLLAVEILSFFSYTNLELMDLSFFAVLAIVFALAFWRLEYGVYFLLAELFLSGKGYLLNFHGISLRIAIFCIIMGIWAGRMIVKKQIPAFFEAKFLKYYFLLSVFVLAGTVSGFLRGNGFSNIFLDANAWLYFLIAFPLFEVIKEEKQIRNVLEIFLAAITVISLKTIGLFLIFARSGFGLIALQTKGAGINSLVFEIYKWIRNSGAGEITQFNGFYRIFLQSQVFVMIGFFILLWLLARKKNNEFLYILLALSSSALFISFSRSFWVGLAAGGLVFLWFLIEKNKWHEIINFFAKSGLSIIIGISIVFAIAPAIIGASGERIDAGTGEAASASRMILLPKLLDKISDNFIFGSGFGATVTYNTRDPRQLEIDLSGKYETYAFEWGYLDIWIKLGIFGLLAYLLLIFKIFIVECKNGASNFGLLCGLIALCITNVFSPYLNHPLGIGAVILIGLAGQIRLLNPIKY